MSFNFSGSIPNGVSVKGNVALGSAIRKTGDSSIIGGKTTTAIMFYGLISSGGPMDYKTQGSQYENFGNYNYGAMARAMGIDENFAKAGAAAQQARNIMKATLKNGKEWLDNNLSLEDKAKYGKYYDTAKNIKENNPDSYDYALFQYFLDESMKMGDETGDYEYLDDPKDQKYIDDGYNDAKNNGYGSDLEPITFDDFSRLDNVGKYVFGLDNGGPIQDFIDNFKNFVDNLSDYINDIFKDFAKGLYDFLDYMSPQWIKDIIAQLYDPLALDLDG
ncbi:hypothetical protein F1B92_08435, partial [Campylobacter sp. FMV-PI01]